MGLLSKPFFIGIFATLSAHCAYRAWAGYAVVRAGGRFSAGLVRLRVLEARAGPGAAAPARPVAFGLLRGGCRVTRAACGGADYSETGEATCVVDGRGEAADGYFFDMGGVGDAQHVPMRWAVEASDDGGGSWRTIGASTWRLLPSGVAEFYPQLPAGRPDAAQLSGGGVAAIDVDLRPPTGWVLLNVVLFVTNSATTFACWATGCLGRQGAFRLSFYSIYVTAWATLTAAAASFGWQCMWREAASTWLRAAVRTVSTCLMVASDGWLIPIFISFGTADVAVSLFTETALYGAAEVRFSTVGLAWFQMLFGLLMLVFRRQAVAQAHGIVRQDKIKYDALWASVRAAPGADAALGRLQAAADRLAGPGGGLAMPRQLHKEDRPTNLRARSAYSAAQRGLAGAILGLRHLVAGSRTRVASGAAVDSKRPPQSQVSVVQALTTRLAWILKTSVCCMDQADSEDGTPIDSLDQLYTQVDICLPRRSF